MIDNSNKNTQKQAKEISSYRSQSSMNISNRRRIKEINTIKKFKKII